MISVSPIQQSHGARANDLLMAQRSKEALSAVGVLYRGRGELLMAAGVIAHAAELKIGHGDEWVRGKEVWSCKGVAPFDTIKITPISWEPLRSRGEAYSALW